MEAKEHQLRTELATLRQKLQDPAIYSDTSYPKLAKRQAKLEHVISLFDDLASTQKHIADAETLAQDPDPSIAEMAKTELEELNAKLEPITARLSEALTPKDPNNEKDVIIEIRAGAGGDESSLFAAELYRMYVRWGELRGCKTELMSESPSEVGGYKEIVFAMRGEDIYKHLKFEAG
ncbi:peptide chain release factor 1, partial [Candidatus Saccharibacteria bacterium]